VRDRIPSNPLFVQLDDVVAPGRAEGVDMAEMSEQAMIAEVEQRLAASYSHIPPDQITRTVQTAHARFDGSSVRDFVPLLVERRARAELARGAITNVGQFALTKG
jgi:hypothetical protein